jgi:hypothetical protein
MAGQPLLRYRITWRRIGDRDRFQHAVTADTPEEARRASVAEIERALGPNSALWEPDQVDEPEGPGPRQASLFRRLVEWFVADRCDWVRRRSATAAERRMANLEPGGTFRWR